MPDTRYLKRRGQTWSVVVAIPPKLQAAAGCAHYVKALGTRDLTEANRRKHHWVAEFKRRIEALRRAAPDPDREVVELALRFRDALERRKGHRSEYSALLSEMRDRAEEIAEDDPEAAERFHAVASGHATFIADLWPRWLEESENTEATKHGNSIVIRDFLMWAGDRVTVEDTDKRRAGDYVSHLLQSKARTTVRRFVSTLSGLWGWMEGKGLVENNPWRAMRFKVRNTNRSRALTDVELVKLLSTPGPRQYQESLPAIIRLALLTGARVSELCEGSVRHREDGLWLVIANGKTEAARREVPLHPLAEPLAKYLGAERTTNVIKAYLRFRRRAGVADRGADFHALRNTFIAMMEGEGVPESTVKLLVGHKRPSMTYGHYSKGERVNLREAIERVRYSDQIMSLI